MVYGMQEISTLLDTHIPLFKPHHLENYGLLMLVKKSLKVIQEGDVFVHRFKGYIPEGDVGNHARNIQYVTFDTSRGVKTVINFHGLWEMGKNKTDTEDRLRQSDNIISFLKTVTSPFVFCGDFNLLPHTESLKKLEQFGLRNLIKEYGVTSTRTRYYEKEHKFADYALVSEGIEVKEFKILPDEVSDHSPMYLEFE
jgi:endonuclease/exonuclease/phosphatase family metal-dependent hydrolase